MKKKQFQKLLSEQKDRVFNYAIYYLKNREDAEDVMQEVFIKLWKNWDSIDRKKTTSWILRVTYHQCIDMIRKRKRYEERMKHSIHQPFETQFAGSDASERPDIYLEMNETQQVLLDAMDQLPEKTKSILLMHYFEGLKYKTIGDIFEIKANAVKIAVHRGKKILKETLKTNYPEMVVSS